MKNFLFGVLATLVCLILAIVIYLFYLVYLVENEDKAFIQCLKMEMKNQDYNEKDITSVNALLLKITRNECSSYYDFYLSEHVDDEENKIIFDSDEYIKETYSHIFYVHSSSGLKND